MTKLERTLFDLNQALVKELEDLINRMFISSDEEKALWSRLNQVKKTFNILQEGNNE